MDNQDDQTPDIFVLGENFAHLGRFEKLRKQFKGNDELLKGVKEQEKLYKLKLEEKNENQGFLFISSGSGNLHFDIESFGGDAMSNDVGSSFYSGNPPPLTKVIESGEFTLVLKETSGELTLRKPNGQQMFHFEGHGSSTLVGAYSGQWRIMTGSNPLASSSAQEETLQLAAEDTAADE